MDQIPFLIFRTDKHNAEFAQWRTASGETAIAIFQDKPKAAKFLELASLGKDWQVFQPALPLLHSIFQSMLQSGVQWAVLDPDAQSAKSLFNLKEVVEAAKSWISQKS